VALPLLAAAACSDGSAEQLAGARPSPLPAVRLLSIPTPPAPTGAAAAGPAQRFGRAPDGSLLPDRGLTPGAYFADVTRDDVCDLHYTQGVRQPQFNAKVEAFAGYGLSVRDRDAYRVDHLIPVSLGGNNALENLWPQPYAGPVGAQGKDALEAHLRGLVCTGTVTLTEAQQTIARDWRAAHQRWMAVPLPAGADAYLPPGSGASPKPPDAVTNGAPCPAEGVVGRTRSKGIKFTCTRNDDGSLSWRKRS
jgi:hypothetical protein